MLSKLHVLADTIIEAIESFKDYFIVDKHITLSEGTLFVITASRSIWFSIFGVQIGQSPMLTHEVWVSIFWVFTAFHLVSFFAAGLKMRIVAMILYALLWSFLAFLLFMATPAHPSVPTFMTFSLLSVFLAVRLMRDKAEA